MTGIAGSVGMFGLGLRLAFVTELIKIHFSACIFLNWGGGIGFHLPCGICKRVQLRGGGVDHCENDCSLELPDGGNILTL